MKNFKMLRFVTMVSFGISLACTPNIFAMRQDNTLDTPLYNEIISTLKDNDHAKSVQDILNKSNKYTRGIDLIFAYFNEVKNATSSPTLLKEILDEIYYDSYKILKIDTDTFSKEIPQNTILMIINIFIELIKKGEKGNEKLTAQIASDLIKKHYNISYLEDTEFAPYKNILSQRESRLYFKLLDQLPLASYEFLDAANDFVLSQSNSIKLTTVGLEMINKLIEKGNKSAIENAQSIMNQIATITGRYQSSNRLIKGYLPELQETIEKLQATLEKNQSRS